jgi:hypothetical protein
MATLLFLLLVLTLFVALGRSATPPEHRIPLTAMTLRDVIRTAAHGVARLNQLHRRRWPNPWDTDDR